MEEAPHAKLDTLMIHALKAACSPEEIQRGLDEYVEIGGLLDDGLKQQVQFDLASFTAATGRELTAEERVRFSEVQTQAVRRTFLGSGMLHKNFLATVDDLQPGTRQRDEELAPVFS